MKNIKTTSDLVRQILYEKPRTRNSDSLLYLEVCKRINPDAMKVPFCYVVDNLKFYSLPPFESVRRSRQKIQRLHPELAGSKEIKKHRAMNEEIVRVYARS